jgi:hypothetical protein
VRVSDEPRTAPSLEAVTRPGTRGSLLLRTRDASPTDSLELSVRYRHDGPLDWVRPIRSNMDPTRASEKENLIASALQETGPGDWGFRLRFVSGSLESVLPAVVCPPQPTAHLPRVMPPTGSQSEIGRVTEVRLPHTTGSRLLDAYGIELARASTFLPGLHDGIGLASRTTVTFRLPRLGVHQ